MLGDSLSDTKTIDPNLKTPTAQKFIKFIVDNEQQMDVVFVTLRSLSFEYGRQDSVLKLGYMLIEWIYDVSILSQSKKKKVYI